MYDLVNGCVGNSFVDVDGGGVVVVYDRFFLSVL